MRESVGAMRKYVGAMRGYAGVCGRMQGHAEKYVRKYAGGGEQGGMR